MRLSEKTIELNFCAQFTRNAPSLALWFGLTQRQEARSGFDACTRIGGRLLIFQFKASKYMLRSGLRRFFLQHDQLTKLQARVSGYWRSVFYVFPLVGTTLELSRNPDVLDQSWFLDVALLPPIAAPTTSSGGPRKRAVHYADVAPGIATIHSEPVDVELLAASEYVAEGFPGADGLNWVFEDFEGFWEFCTFLLPTSAGAVIPPAGGGWRSGSGQLSI